MISDLLDVIEVQLAAPHKVRVIAKDKDRPNAEAIIAMAVARRGVETSFFTIAPSGQYVDGDHFAFRARAHTEGGN